MNNLCSKCVNRNPNKYCKAGRMMYKSKTCVRFELGKPLDRLKEPRIKNYENHPVIKAMRIYQAETQRYINNV